MAEALSGVVASQASSIGLLETIADGCPSFRPHWQQFLNEWSGEDEFPIYLAFDLLAGYAVRLFESDQAQSPKHLFAAIERALETGNPEVIKAIEVGLLERVKHAKGAKNPPLRKWFVAQLLPITKAAWRAA